MSNKTSNNTERLKQLAKELRESNEIKRFYGNNFTEGSKYCVVSEAELIPTAEAIEEVLAEREQKDKRIQELEELVAKFKTVDYMFRIDSYSNRYDMRRIYFEWLDSIPKQVVMDKIKENKQILDKTNDGNLRERLYIENGIMKELLEGEGK